MGIYLLQGILIGLLFGVPVGAMTVQRTFNHGMKAGFLTGLGSSVADCLYACIGAFGLTIISDFLLNYQTVINILGRSLIVFMGIRILVRKSNMDEVKPLSARRTELFGAKMFASSFLVGITNPTAILTFLFVFTYFEISGNMSVLQGTQLVIGIFIGTYIWWSALSVLAAYLKKKLLAPRLQIMNKVFGAILAVFGVAVFIRTFI